MTDLVTLDEAKQHLRVDHDEEDTLIQGYLDAAALYCLEHCNRAEPPEGSELVFKQATLLVLGHWYRSRMAVTAAIGSEPPHAVTALISRHRLWNI
jgi:uncharacterized phage protein (predicted DNA packaging)